MQPTPSNEGRSRLLEEDKSIVLPDKDKGLNFQDGVEKDNYSQNEIDDILKILGGAKN